MARNSSVNNTSEVNEFDLEVWVNFLSTARREEPAWVQTAFIIAVYVMISLGLAGNVLTCTVICIDKTMHTTTNYYLFNLAVSDIIVIFIVLLGAVDYFEYNDQWRCKLHIYFLIVLLNNSVLTVTILAVERYVAIWYPLKRRSGPVWRRVCKVITCVWVLAILESLPDLWIIDVVRQNRSVMCSQIPTPFARIVNGFLALITFVVPMVIVMFMYVMIALKVNATQNFCSDGGVFNYRDNRTKVNKMVVILALAFLVCWLPIFIIRVMIFVLEINQLMALVKWWSIGQRFMFINSFFSVVLNPILFNLISTKFRESLARMWMINIRRNG